MRTLLEKVSHLKSNPKVWKRLLDSVDILNVHNNDSRFSFCALGIREALKTYFNEFGIDEDIKETSWWLQKTKDLKDKRILREDRLIFFVCGHLPVDIETYDFEQISTKYTECTNKISDIVHFNEELNETGTLSRIGELLNVVDELAKMADELKKRINNSVCEYLYNELTDKFLSESIDEVEETGGHNCFDEFDLHEADLSIEQIDRCVFSFAGKGDVVYEKWHDKEDDPWPVSFPFTCVGTINVTHIGDSVTGDIDLELVHVDNDDWFGDPSEFEDMEGSNSVEPCTQLLTVTTAQDETVADMSSIFPALDDLGIH